MRFARPLALTAAMLLAMGAAAAQAQPNFDFEDGLRGWTAVGDAFTTPLEVSRTDPDRFPASPLGGDYWKGTPYTAGHSGRFLLISSGPGRGTLTSDSFEIAAEHRYVSLRLGGQDVGRATRVELQVVNDPGPGSVVWETTGPGIELLQLRVFTIPPALVGRTVRVAIVDESPAAHLIVDDIRFGVEPPPPRAGAVWGIGDFHAHPMSHLAFGALRGVHALWGRPGGVATDYARNRRLFELDLPQCSNDHGGGNTAGIFINTVEKRILPQDLRPQGFRATVRALWRLLTGHFTRHPDEGAPAFEHHPSFLSGAHHQMHVTQIHRAWQGGLRLMVAIAVHNEGVEFLASSPGKEPPSSEREVLDAQVCGIRRLAALNAEWMQIAYSPGEARDIVHSGKLAVVLGAELDRLGDLGGFATLDDEAQYLWDLGIRQVTPIHGIDNRLGGVAVFEPAYNTQNDLLNRGSLDPADLERWQPVFFDVRDGGCTTGPLAGLRGECVLFKLGATQERAVVARTIFSPFTATPTLRQIDVPRYREHGGHLNARGLTADGGSYIAALRRRGMLVGLEHMSQRAVDDMVRVVGDDYPLLVSHAHFRAVAIHDRRRTTAEGFLPDEHDIADSTVERVRRSGGVTGVFATENPIEPPPGLQLPFPNDCSGSSKTFALSLLYGLTRMGGGGIGLATDFTFIPQTAPRFGVNACWALKDHWDARPGAGPLRDQYRPDLQDNGVRYEGVAPAAGVRVGTSAPLKPYTMGRRTFDFNVDGLAHYGMLPDLLQDLKNVGADRAIFEALFSSAEAYIAMWERAERQSQLTPPAPFTPRPLPCEAICRGLCP